MKRLTFMLLGALLSLTMLGCASSNAAGEKQNNATVPAAAAQNQNHSQRPDADGDADVTFELM